MEMFDNFDEDLFITEQEKPAPNLNYIAKQCNPCWFLSDEIQESEDKINILRHKADYYYLRRDYASAASEYKAIIDELNPSASNVTKREIFENLSRSLIETGEVVEAKNLALKVHDMSLNNDHYTVSFSLLCDVYLANNEFYDLVLASMNLVNFHQVNSDMWLKLLFSYGVYFNIPLVIVNKLLNKSGKIPSRDSTIDDKIYTNKKEIICACLVRVIDILESVRSTSNGFTLELNLKYQKALNEELNNLGLSSNFINLAKKKMTVIGFFSKDENSLEFVDRGSSKFQPQKKNDFNYQHITSLSDFENKWFNWIKDI